MVTIILQVKLACPGPIFTKNIPVKTNVLQAPDQINLVHYFLNFTDS
jgi:hypothetical protein